MFRREGGVVFTRKKRGQSTLQEMDNNLQAKAG
jgi:hypothetical protein